MGQYLRALSDEERQRVFSLLHEERFCDQAQAGVYATLLDERHYLCSERTMYHILGENHEVRKFCNAHDVGIVKAHVRKNHVQVLVSVPPYLSASRLM